MQSRYSGYADGEFDTYWFEKNLQGDIIAVYDEDGTKLVEYLYDAWGNFTTEYFNLGEYDYALDFNPFRYRGYYYDEETGFYYLNSRYYDPVTGRFINADGYISTGKGILGNNMYAYCRNSPVTLVDYTGESPIAVLLLSALIIGITCLLTSDNDQTAKKEAAAAQKYNEDTIDINGSNPDASVKVNIDGDKIRIIGSHKISDVYEQRAILNVVTNHPEYTGVQYSNDMVIEWSAHNLAYRLCKYKWGKQILGSIFKLEDPKPRFADVDIEGRDEHQTLYNIFTLWGVISW